MEYRFNAKEWRGLALEERVKRCRLMAHEARALAQTASGSLRQSYVRLAEQWESLLTDMQREATAMGGRATWSLARMIERMWHPGG
jgi:hypothetical protein